MKPQKELLTEAEVEAMGLASVKTLSNWRVLRKGPPYCKVGGKLVRYRRSDIEAWLQANTVETRGAA